MFSFLLTADNYPDMLDYPMSESLYYGAFFILASLLGLFIFSSLVISSFEKEYNSLFAHASQKDKCVPSA
jgi:hypothetical protein